MSACVRDRGNAIFTVHYNGIQNRLPAVQKLTLNAAIISLIDPETRPSIIPSNRVTRLLVPFETPA